MDVGDLINSLNDLVNTFEDAVIRLDDVNKKLIDTGVGLEIVSNESDALKGNYDKLNKNYEELNKKISDTVGSLQNLNEKMNEKGEKTPVATPVTIKQPPQKVSSSGKVENKAQIGSLLSDVLNRAMYGGRSLSMQGVGRSLGVGKGASGVLAAIDTVIKVIEFGIKKAAEYMVLEYENQMRALEAITTNNVNSMKANLALWQNSLNGAYEAQNLAMSSNLKMIEAQNATDLANLKLRNSWLKWIPIYGTYLEYGEKEMEEMQKMQQQRLQQAQEVIQEGEGYAKQIDEYLKKQDQAIRDYTRSVGLSVDQTAGFEDRMLSLGETLASFNYTIDQVLKMQSQIQQQSGRIINYTNDQYTQLGSLGKIMGDETVTHIQSEMVIFNQSVDDSAKIMTDMYNYANTMGISQKKLSQDVVNNFKLANKYQFKNGIQGYIEFAKWAENVRFNISQLGSALEKIQTGGLEGVIKQSAQLQVLGGNIAMHADPLRMAYQAYNDPAGYAKDIVESLKGQGVFDKNTGDVYRDTISQMMVRGVAEARNLSYDDLVTMIREDVKKTNVGQELKGSNLSTEQIDAIANAAQYNQKTQQWYVTDLQGQTHSLKELEQTPQLIEEILSNNKDEDMLKYAQKTLSAVETIAQTATSVSAILSKAGFDDFMSQVNETSKVTETTFKRNADSVTDAVMQVRQQNLDSTNKQLEGLATLGYKIREAYSTQAQANEDIARIKELLEKRYGEAIVKNEINRDVKNTSAKRKEDFNKSTEMARNGQARTSEYRQAVKETKESSYKADLANLAYYLEKEQNASWGGSELWYGLEVKAAKKRAETSGLSTRRKKEDIKQDIEDVYAKFNLNTEDAVAIADGAPMAVAARNITSINDGLASADKRDTAIFAKTGGPFDKLFNGVFLKVNEIYDKVVAGIVAAPFSPAMEYAREGSRSIEEQIRRQGRGDNSPIRFETLKIEMNGHLELSSGGQSIDIMNELQNNPLLIREVAKMISDSLSAKFYGGKAEVMPGQNTYFK